MPRNTPQKLQLGRLLRHDERSRNYPADTAPVESVVHRHYGAAMDQGEVGACTGYALVQNLRTVPLFRADERLSRVHALDVYAHATALDNIAGTYPPDDPGSSGLGAAQAAKALGLVTGYAHAFGLDHALGALALGPVMVGTDWYESMYAPRGDAAMLEVSGPVVGGHEYALTALDARAKAVRVLNSWGPNWGIRGAAWLTFADLGRLLDRDGDVTALVRA